MLRSRGRGKPLRIRRGIRKGVEAPVADGLGARPEARGLGGFLRVDRPHQPERPDRVERFHRIGIGGLPP